MLTAAELERMIEDTGGVRARFTPTSQQGAAKVTTWVKDDVVDHTAVAMGYAGGIQVGQHTLVGVTEILDDIRIDQPVEVQNPDGTWTPYEIRHRQKEDGGATTRIEIVPSG